MTKNISLSALCNIFLIGQNRLIIKNRSHRVWDLEYLDEYNNLWSIGHYFPKTGTCKIVEDVTIESKIEKYVSVNPNHKKDYIPI